ncbi:MAG: phosphate transport system permease protein, partial [Solirubrobacteraceae bacterium]|nr:phosphate transport system permease protein [Solirubrobacteraceae bacterium]
MAAPTPNAAPAGGPGADLLRVRSSRSVSEAAIRAALLAAAAISVLTTILIVVSLLRETLSFFGDVSFLDYLTGGRWTPQLGGAQASFGVLPLVAGTLYITAIAMVVAIPLGLLCAIYLAEYAPARVRKVVKPVLEVLAGVPTVVYGFFALTFLTPLIQDLWFLPGDPPAVFNALSAGLVMGVMILPTVASLSEDA